MAAAAIKKGRKRYRSKAVHEYKYGPNKWAMEELGQTVERCLALSCDGLGWVIICFNYTV